MFISSNYIVTSPCHFRTLHLNAAPQHLCMSDTLHLSEISLQTERLYPLLRPGICSSHSLLLFTLSILQVFPVCMNAFMIESDRGQYSWRSQVYVVLFSPKSSAEVKKKARPPAASSSMQKDLKLKKLVSLAEFKGVRDKSVG